MFKSHGKDITTGFYFLINVVVLNFLFIESWNKMYHVFHKKIKLKLKLKILSSTTNFNIYNKNI